MCNDPVYFISNPQLKNGIVSPGFLMAEINDDNIVVTNYLFNSGEIVKENEFKKILKKKII